MINYRMIKTETIFENLSSANNWSNCYPCIPSKKFTRYLLSILNLHCLVINTSLLNLHCIVLNITIQVLPQDTIQQKWFIRKLITSNFYWIFIRPRPQCNFGAFLQSPLLVFFGSPLSYYIENLQCLCLVIEHPSTAFFYCKMIMSPNVVDPSC